MGAVWKAHDPLLKRDVALKFLPEDMAEDPRARKRFLEEARYQSRMNHPGVARVFDAGDLEGRLHISIEWVDGQTASNLAARGPVPFAEALRIIADAADALRHAHSQGTCHRDVTGRNIMLERGGRVVLLDFGLARVPSSQHLSSTGSVAGTPAYMSPEVAQGKLKASKSELRPLILADIYGLGVVLYELLTGRLPFTGTNVPSMLYSVIHESPDPPSRCNPSLPEKIDRLVLKALAKRPEDRYADAEDMAIALRSFGRRRFPVRVPVAAPTRAFAEARQLAVLPFEDVSADPNPGGRERAFAVGIAEAVSASLSRTAGLQVIPPRAIRMRHADSEDLAHHARELGADLVLCGTVQRQGDRLRVTSQLYDPALGGQVVDMQNLDGALHEIFQIQDRLAEEVLRALRLEPGSGGTLQSQENLRAVAAQEQFLQALGYLQRFDSEAAVDGAIHILEGLNQRNSRSASVRAALGRACLYKYQLTRERTWAFRAAGECQKAISLEPRSPEVLVTLAQVQRTTGKPREAVATFQRALRLRADQVEAWIGLAKAEENLGRLSKAEEAYRKAISLRPQYWGTYNELGGFFFNHGRYHEAAAMWRRVVELTPDNARGYFNLGAVLWRSGDSKSSIEAYHKSILIRPEGSAYSSLGAVHYFLGNFAEAAAMFEKGVALRPAEPRTWGNLGDAYRWMTGMEQRSAEAFDEAIALMKDKLGINPRQPEELGWLAEWLAKRGRKVEAGRALRKALKLAPEDINCMARAVIVHNLAGNRDVALHWLNEALTHGYGFSEFEQDPELKELREDPRFSEVVRQNVAK